MEQKYWELRERWERAEDKYLGHPTVENFIASVEAREDFQNFCVKILEKLMDENSDVLTNLKFI
jgi:hypothetical protein